MCKEKHLLYFQKNTWYISPSCVRCLLWAFYSRFHWWVPSLTIEEGTKLVVLAMDGRQDALFCHKFLPDFQFSQESLAQNHDHLSHRRTLKEPLILMADGISMVEARDFRYHTWLSVQGWDSPCHVTWNRCLGALLLKEISQSCVEIMT